MKPLSDSALAHLQSLTDWPDLSGTRYTALEEIGQGGMGVVFRARDALLEREVALKVLRHPEAPADLAERLGREAVILAGLEHPGIVPVYDTGVLPDGRRYYVMKLVRGTRLDEWLRAERSLRERLELFLRICDTVAFAHARGIIHRDLKPGNVMVGEFGEVLVLDWGVAKLVGAAGGNSSGAAASGVSGVPRASGHVTGHGAVIGTEGYMAPEQAMGRTDLVDQRTDVFGLGAMLRAMAGPGAPRRLQAIAARASATDRDLRYGGAPDLAADVNRLLDGDPVTAYHESPLERLWRVAGRYQTAIVLVLVYLLLRALFLVFGGF